MALIKFCPQCGSKFSRPEIKTGRCYVCEYYKKVVWYLSKTVERRQIGRR